MARRTEKLARLRAVKQSWAVVERPTPRFRWLRKAKNFVPIVLTGGMGDAILAVDLLDAIKTTMGPVRVWTSHHRALRFMTETLWDEDEVWIEDGTFPGFDWWISVNSVVRFEFSRNFKRFLHNSPHVQRRYIEWMGWWSSPEWSTLMRIHPYADDMLADKAIQKGFNRRTLPFAMLGIQEIHRTLDVGAREYDMEPFITVHDGFEVAQGPFVDGRATKTWNLRHWKSFIDGFRKQYPLHMIVQLGGPTSRPIPGVDISLVGRKIEESLSVLSRSSLHVDGDSGLVHAARSMDVPAVVMFGPTPHKFFGHPENVNLAPKECGGCWWSKKTWLSACPVEEDNPACMDSIRPEAVLDAVGKVL